MKAGVQGSGIFKALFAAVASCLVLFLAVPILVMVCAETPASLWQTLLERDVMQALWVSISAATISTGLAVVFGVPLAYLLARKDFPGKSLVLATIDMPIVIPHLVAGVALLAVLGANGLLGAQLGNVGVRFVDALPGTVAAMLFVSAPFVVNAARLGFEAVDERLEKASRSLGATATRTFLLVTLPLGAPGIISGAIMAWARAVSEFGAVLVIAYYPRIGPTLIYERLMSFGLKSARPVAVLLVFVCLALFAVVRVSSWRKAPGGGKKFNA